MGVWRRQYFLQEVRRQSFKEELNAFGVANGEVGFPDELLEIGYVLVNFEPFHDKPGEFGVGSFLLGTVLVLLVEFALESNPNFRDILEEGIVQDSSHFPYPT